jgi:hypothetical protein
LKGAATRLGRLDWANLLVSQLVKLGFEHVVKPENLQKIAQGGMALFRWIWAAGQGLLGP